MKKPTVIFGMYVLLLLIAIVAIAVGSITVPFQDLMQVLFYGEQNAFHTIVWNIRIPRIALAIIIGANLAISGALLQAVVGNPLADPGLTGVTSGAAISVLFIMLVRPEWTALIPIVAIVGGAFTAFIVYFLAWQKGKISPLRIILSGVAVNGLIGGFIGLLSILYSEKLPSALQWLNGSLGSVNATDVFVLLPYSIVGWILSFLVIRKTNIIRMGDDVAANLGENINRTRLQLSMIAIFLAAISVSRVGMIGFVGLIVPHMARFLVGSDYKYLLPMSIAMGSFVLLSADTVSRYAFAPLEIPAGIVMAIVGAPYFLYLMRRGGV